MVAADHRSEYRKNTTARYAKTDRVEAETLVPGHPGFLCVLIWKEINSTLAHYRGRRGPADHRRHRPRCQNSELEG